MKIRDNSIDALRGFAIFAMVAANMAANNYAEPHAFVFRLYGSFAAPTFVFLSGFMISFTSCYKKYGFLYFLKRGMAVLVVAALIDYFFWNLIPFVSFDVLYIIGIALPIGFLFSKVNKWFTLLFCVFIFGLTPWVQNYFGYADLPAEIRTGSETIKIEWADAKLLKHFLSDGWFPVFPWLAVSLLGSFFGKFRVEMGPGNTKYEFFLCGLVLFFGGMTIWIISNPTLMTRESYSELFYPPTYGYFGVFLGALLMVLPVFYKFNCHPLLNFFAVYGRSSLLMYILHILFMVLFFTKWFGAMDFWIFVQVYLWHVFFLWWIARFTQLLKGQIEKLPFLLRFIIGG